MPIFEYHCRSCQSRFETLLRGSELPVCPKCQGQDLEKLLSVFAVSSGGSSSFGSSCSGGSCGLPESGGGCATGACPFN